MRVALVVCPGWTMASPPLGAPLLKAYVVQRGHECVVTDLAALLLGQIDEADRDLLIHSNYDFLMSRERVRAFIAKYRALVDRELERVLDFRPDVVGFTAYSSTRIFSEEIAVLLKARKPSLRVVFGGPEGKQMAENKVPPHDVIDAVVPGEGEVAFAGLLEAMSAGELRPSPGALVRSEGKLVWLGDAHPVEDLDALPFPDFSDLPLRNYLYPPTLVTYFSRGCYKKCTFCDVEYNWGRWRNRSGERVLAEIKHLLKLYPATERFMFCDSITNANVKALSGFCDGVTAANRAGELPPFTWGGYQAIRPDMTREVLVKMRDSGCRELWIGIESGSQKVLNLMKKGYRVEHADRILKDCAELGIKTLVLLMVGYPGETEADFEQTLDFLRRNAPYIPKISCSENFTYITNNTYLHRHAFDAYGVDPGTFDADYWQTKDGTNTYLDRCNRFERLAKTAQEVNVHFGSQLDIVKAHKTRWLEQQRQKAAI